MGSPNLAGGQTLRLNTGTQLVPVTVQDTVSYFPTMLNRNEPFLLVSLKSFEDYTRRLPRGILSPPKEYWLSLEQGVNEDEAIRSVREATSVSSNIRNRNGLVDLAQRDPLSGGGWNGLTLLGLGALTIVVTLALVTHALVAIHGSRVELTVTHALGFSRAQLVSLLVLERALAGARSGRRHRANGRRGNRLLPRQLDPWLHGADFQWPAHHPAHGFDRPGMAYRPGDSEPGHCHGAGHGGCRRRRGAPPTL